MTMRVYYVRHGESEANVANVVAGSGHDSPLTKNGRAQARHAGQELKDKHIDLIVCSPLARTVDTATHIAEEVGYDPDKIIKNILLTEREMGTLEQKPYAEYVEAMKKGIHYEGMETRKEMVARARKALDWIKTQDAQNVVLVSHGGTGRAIRAVVEGMHHDELYKLEGFGNTEIYEFEL